MRPAFAFFLLAFAAIAWTAPPAVSRETRPEPDRGPAGPFTGSAVCASCHEKFHGLWATSFHALAMRPYNDAFARERLTSMREELAVGTARCLAQTGPGQGWITEKRDGKERRYPIAYVLGGKDVFYFLTPQDKGRLQTLPLAYDVRKRKWFDMAASGLRHAASGPGRPLDWKDWPYTFNTSCRGCHASQFTAGYDPAADTYRSAWTEPGVNCETCHGPSRDHVEVCRNAPKGQAPQDLRIIRGGRAWSREQQNAQCGSCHARSVALAPEFRPGERFFDHFDLVTYESPDFYPDGRDLGENYTFASWSRSPCVRSGKLDCMHCHTSSGRYKFADPARANQACAPCHAERAANSPAHTHHPAGGPGDRCAACHMPTTSFARIRRSDHSMLPPTPSATLAYGSPNACNNCHTDKDAAWADQKVRAWRERDYQAPVLRQADLVRAARQGDWSRLPEIAGYVAAPESDPVAAASLLRLLRACPSQDKEAPALRAAKSPSPLVRAAAADALAASPSRTAGETLTTLAADEFRVVRVRAAAALLESPREDAVPREETPAVKRAVDEYLDTLKARPDLWTSQYGLGNAALKRGDMNLAATRFEAAARLSPSSAAPLVNASLAYAGLGEPGKAKRALEKALRLQPNDPSANFNMGLLQVELGDRAEAEKRLRAALRADPNLAGAAFNLGVLLAQDRPEEALAFCRQAVRLRPDVAKYAYTVAYYQVRFGNRTEAERVLAALLRRHPDCREAAGLLEAIRRRR